MSVQKMFHVSIVGHASIKRKLLHNLQRRGVMQIISMHEEERPVDDTAQSISVKETIPLPHALQDRLLLHTKSIKKTEKEIQLIKSAIDFLEPFDEKAGMFDSEYTVMTVKEYLDAPARLNYEPIVKEINEIINRRAEIERRITAVQVRRDELLPWVPLDLIPAHMPKWEFTDYLFGVVPSADRAALIRSLEELDIDGYDLTPINDVGDRVLYMLITYGADTEAVHNEIKKHGWTKAPLDNLTTTVATALENIEIEIAALKTELSIITDRARERVTYRTDLKIMYDHKRNELQRYAVEEQFMHTETCFILTGWVSASDIEYVKDYARSVDELDVDIRLPLPEEKPPVQLENPKPARPFELITELFGIPKYKEVDPTAIMTPFFILFFGLCLADIGYALTSPLIVWVVLRMMTGGKGMDRIFKIILYSMIPAIIIGFFAGGFFGIPLREVSFMKPIYALPIIQPLADAFNMNGDTIFLTTLIIGSIALLAGRIVAFIHKLTHDMKESAFLDELPWILTSIGFPIWLFVSFLKLVPADALPSWFYFSISLGKPATMMITNPLLIIGLLMVVTFSGREAKSIGGRIAGGLFNAYGISGLLGDILSYSRLMALGLGSGVIASVINSLSGMVANADGIVNKIVMGIIVGFLLIASHAINIILAVMSSMVHTMRLQFVEFFSKFYEGGGSKFIPFNNRYEYLQIKNSTQKI